MKKIHRPLGLSESVSSGFRTALLAACALAATATAADAPPSDTQSSLQPVPAAASPNPGEPPRPRSAQEMLASAEKLPVAPALVVTVQLQSDGSLQILGTHAFDEDYRFLPHGSAFSPSHRLKLTIENQTYSADVQTSHVTVSEYIGDDNKPHGGMTVTPRMERIEVPIDLRGLIGADTPQATLRVIADGETSGEIEVVSGDAVSATFPYTLTVEPLSDK